MSDHKSQDTTITWISYNTVDSNKMHELIEKKLENEIKKKLRSMCKIADSDRSGLIDKEVLIGLLEENKIALRPRKKFIDQNDKVNYFEFTRNIRR